MQGCKNALTSRQDECLRRWVEQMQHVKCQEKMNRKRRRKTSQNKTPKNDHFQRLSLSLSLSHTHIPTLDNNIQIIVLCVFVLNAFHCLPPPSHGIVAWRPRQWGSNVAVTYGDCAPEIATWIYFIALQVCMLHTSTYLSIIYAAMVPNGRYR